MGRQPPPANDSVTGCQKVYYNSKPQLRHPGHNYYGTPLVTTLTNAFHNFTNIILPNRCVICERPIHPASRSPLCVEHNRDLLPNQPPTCSRCGRKMSGQSVETLLCAKCRSGQVHFDAGHSAYIFKDVLREVVHLFKYRKRRYLRFYLGEILLRYVKENVDLSKCDLIVPVPLHWRRRWTRGFNQAADLAKPLSRHFAMPILRGALRRIRYTSPQIGLSSAERQDNIDNAFKVVRLEKVAGRRILLIDDIITSGATLSECARVLKLAKAARVTILTLAHPSDVVTSEASPSSNGLHT